MGTDNELPLAPCGPPQRAPPGSLWARTTSSPWLLVGPHNELPQAPCGLPQRASLGLPWAPTTSSPGLFVGPHNEFPQVPCGPPQETRFGLLVGPHNELPQISSSAPARRAELPRTPCEPPHRAPRRVGSASCQSLRAPSTTSPVPLVGSPQRAPQAASPRLLVSHNELPPGSLRASATS